MASILDVGLTSLFSAIFVFLLVYALTWGALSRFAPFGKDNRGSYAIIAFAIAFLMAIAPPARNFVMFVAPWYLALAIVIFFILFIVGMFGLSAEKDLPNIIKNGRVHTWIVILSIVIMIGGFAFTFGQSAYQAGNPDLAAPAGETGTTIGTGTNVISAGQPYQPPGTVVVQEGVPPSTYSGYTYANGPQPGQPGSTATPSFQTNLINTLIHPKVLGLMITMFIAAVAIYFLSGSP